MGEEPWEVDLLTYLSICEPDNLVRVSGSTYSTRDHDSLRISNGKWYWFSRGFGGATALDYLVRVRSLSREEAMDRIRERVHTDFPLPVREPKEEKKLVLPALVRDPVRVRAYLRSRGIREAVIRYLETHALLFETESFHSALFPGYDSRGIIRYAAVRGTSGDYKGELHGSDKRFGFSLGSGKETREVHLFESAVDLISCLSLRTGDFLPAEGEALLSLGGVSGQKSAKLPPALEQFLTDHPFVQTLRLHLDNDEPGRAASEGIAALLGSRIKVLNEPPKAGCKDVNDQLMEKRKKERER